MERRRFLGAALAGAAGSALGVPPAGRRWRISAVTYRGRTEVEDGFEAYLAVRGVALDIAWHDIGRDPARLPATIAAIRAEGPDLVYTWGTTVSLGVLGAYDRIDPARHVTGVPAVFTLVADPVGARLVPSMTHPGRAATGVSHSAPLAAQLRAMRAYRRFARLGVLYSPHEENARLVVAALAELARREGFELIGRELPGAAQAGPAIAAGTAAIEQLHRDGAEWLYLPPDSQLTALAGELLPRAAALGLPSFASTEALIHAGALVGVVSRYHSVGQFTALKAAQILVDGRAPASIPVETLSRFSLVINLPVAHRLRLPPPLAMLDYAELLDSPAAGSVR